jgi:hypothetical protein
MNRRTFFKMIGIIGAALYVQPACAAGWDKYEDGIHVLDDDLIVFSKDTRGKGRAIITSADGKPPRVWVNDGVHIKDLWFGGALPKDGTDHLQIHGSGTVQNCTFWNYTECFEEGTAHAGQNLLQNNRFVNCGYENNSHSAYVTTQQPTGLGSIIEGNIFIGGQGYHMHFWHSPTNHVFRNNFLGSAWNGLALGGYDLLATKNIFWSLARRDIWTGELIFFTNWSTFNFEENFIGYVNNRLEYWAQEGGISRNNYHFKKSFYLPEPDINPTIVPEGDEGLYLGHTEAEIENAIANIETSFAGTIEEIYADDSIEGNFTVLKECLDAFGSVPLESTSVKRRKNKYATSP